MPKKPRRRKKSSKKSSRRKHWWFRLLLMGCLAIVAALAFYGALAFTYDLDELGQMPERTLVFDRFGNEIGRLHGENRITVPLEDVSPDFVDALLAREDTRFYAHPGLDPIGIARAIVSNIRRARLREGASTLTQQLARNSYALGGRNLHRKLLEAALAVRIEQALTKEEILELYINRIFYGRGLYGLETATRRYFNKPASALTLSESATMAALIRSPNRFNPVADLETATRERDLVLGRMEQLGMVTEAEAARAKEQRLSVAPDAGITRQASDALATIADELAAILSEEQREDGGLRVYTTLDPRWQRAAEAALATGLDRFEKRPGYRHAIKRRSRVEPGDASTPYLQGAVVLLDNATGGLRAIVGGRDFDESSFNRARYARRQIGSTIKPFLYTLAWQSGVLPGSRVNDAPLVRGEIPGADRWQPANADGRSLGFQPAENGLVHSRNTMTVRIGNVVGPIPFVQWLTRAGFRAPESPSPTVYLGAFEATLQELVAAYSLFPNHGKKRQPFIIEKVETQAGEPVFLATRAEYRLCDPAATWLTTRALRKAITEGTGRSARLNYPAAGKTGTTNDARDVWFVGYSPELTCGVWCGFDQPRPIGAGAAGSTLALPIWKSVMEAATSKRTDFHPPMKLVETTLCWHSGGLARNGCFHAEASYTDTLPAAVIPRALCDVHEGYQIDGEFEQSPASLPERAWRSIGRLFGGD